jgi:hypothetical protein
MSAATRGPGVSDAMHGKGIAARKKRLAKKAADDESVRQLASEFSTTEAAIREADELERVLRRYPGDV